MKDLQEFQRTNLNHLGKPLKVDGVQGPETEWALDFGTLCIARRSAVCTAQSHIGLTEDPPASNKDPGGFIRRWLARCGVKEPAPWCAAFASWCLGDGIWIAGAQALGKHYPSTLRPLCGDLMWYPTDAKKGLGHCGIVIGVSANEVMTIEGNCDNAVRCVRRPRAGLRFSRVFEDTSGTSPGVVATVQLAPGATR